MSPQCLACRRAFKNGRALKIHISKSKECGVAWNQELDRELLPGDTSHHSTNPISDAEQLDWLQPEHDPLPASPERSPEPPAKRPWVTVEEVDDEEAPGRYIEPYPGNAAESLGPGQTHFHQLREEQEARGQPPWAPFADMEEWVLAKWLMGRVNQTGIDEFLKLPIVSTNLLLHYFRSFDKL
jgi:hypothetical protein